MASDLDEVNGANTPGCVARHTRVSQCVETVILACILDPLSLEL